jgi:hypothetical protein
MSTKTCKKCEVEKDVGEFSKNKSKKDGLQNWCKLCRKEDYEANRDKRKEWRETNREKIHAKQKEYREANLEKIHTKQKEYYEANRDKNKEYRQANREKILAKQKEWCEANRDKQKEWREANREKINAKAKERYEANREKMRAKAKERYEANREKMRVRINKSRNKRFKEDLKFRISHNLRARFSNALKAQGAKKFTSTMDLIGCSPEFLTKYLEKQIKPGTKREDYHIDHIIPCVYFDLTKEEEQKMCFHWTNLQLLLGPANMSKSDDVIWSGHVYKPDEVPSEIREEIYAHCRSNMTLRSS